MREVVSGVVIREADHWKVDRPNVPDIFTPPPPRTDEEVLRLREPDDEDEDASEEE